MTIDQKMKLDALIDEFSRDQDIIDAVKEIESSPRITDGHYGRYMNFLSPYASKATALYIISQALLKAGANHRGVTSALRIIAG